MTESPTNMTICLTDPFMKKNEPCYGLTPFLSLWKHGTDYEPRVPATPTLVLTPV